NSMLPPLFSPAERTELTRPLPLNPFDAGHVALAAGARRSFRETVQAQNLARLAELKVPRVYLPHLFEGAENLDALRDLARRL
ncbi:MAG: hypothetical protein RMJ98_16085, partial [Myxococcales bacterium]|nr:hypothetical protein [Myxococcales bacterium]